MEGRGCYQLLLHNKLCSGSSVYLYGVGRYVFCVVCLSVFRYLSY